MNSALELIHETNSPREVLKNKMKYAASDITSKSANVGCRAKGVVYSESVAGYLKFEFKSDDVREKR